eukprot:gb/GECG01008492.1/.p1 GENE.gb/GECG01008492.1/~~gb/GECG01008492.1/.p1  ORF type:complete len:819 (+),score=130.72 gb/GECG01008492.1/:1-2457(+)
MDESAKENEQKSIESSLSEEERARFDELLGSVPETGVQGLEAPEVLAFLIKKHPTNSQGFQDDMQRWLTDQLELPVWETAASRRHKPNPKAAETTPEGHPTNAVKKEGQRQPANERGPKQRGGRREGGPSRSNGKGQQQQSRGRGERPSNKPDKSAPSRQQERTGPSQGPKGSKGGGQNAPQQRPKKTDSEATTKVVQQPKGAWGEKPLQQVLQEKQQQHQRPPAPPQQEETAKPVTNEEGRQRSSNNKQKSRGGKRGKQKQEAEEPRQAGAVEHPAGESSTPSSELDQNPQPVEASRRHPPSGDVASARNVVPQEQKVRLGEVGNAPEGSFSFGLEAQPPQETSAPTQRLNFGSIESLAKSDIKFGVQEEDTVSYETEMAQGGIRNLSVASGTQEEVRFPPAEQKVTQVQDLEAERIAQAHAQAQAEEQHRKEQEQEFYEHNGDGRQRRQHNGRQQPQQSDNRRGGGRSHNRNSSGRGRGAKNQGYGGRANEATSSGMVPGMPGNMMGMDAGNYNMYGGQMPPMPMGMGDFSGMGAFMGGPMPMHGAPVNEQGYYGNFPMQNFYPTASASLQSSGPSSSGSMHTNDAPAHDAPASAPPGIAPAEKGFPPMGQNFGNQPPSQGSHAGQKGVQHQQPQNFAPYNPAGFSTYSGYQNPYAFQIPGSMAMNPQGAFFPNHNAFSMQPQKNAAAQGVPAQSPPRGGSQQPQNFFAQQSGPPGLKGGQFGFPGVAGNQQIPMQQHPVNREPADYNNAFVAQGASSGLDNNQPAGIPNGYEFTNAPAPQRGGHAPNAFGNPTEFGSYTVPQSSSLPHGNSWYTQ